MLLKVEKKNTEQKNKNQPPKGRGLIALKDIKICSTSLIKVMQINEITFLTNNTGKIQKFNRTTVARTGLCKTVLP